MLLTLLIKGFWYFGMIHYYSQQIFTLIDKVSNSTKPFDYVFKLFFNEGAMKEKEKTYICNNPLITISYQLGKSIEKHLSRQKPKKKEPFYRNIAAAAPQISPLWWIGGTLLITFGAVKMHGCLTRKFHTASDIPVEYFKQRRKILGRVVAVNDSDNIRIIHLSPWNRTINFLFWPFSRLLQSKKKIKSNFTINVRLAGMDAPEMGHFGLGAAQPMAITAHEFLQSYTLNRLVTIQLLRMDQYGRAVALVYRAPSPSYFALLAVGAGEWFWRWRKACVNVEMVRRGLACVYRLGGKEYGPLEAEFIKAEKQAKQAKRGIWSLSNLILPHEYKFANNKNKSKFNN